MCSFVRMAEAHGLGCLAQFVVNDGFLGLLLARVPEEEMALQCCFSVEAKGW